MLVVYDNIVHDRLKFCGFTRDIILCDLEFTDLTHRNGGAQFNNFAKKLLTEKAERIAKKIEKVNNKIQKSIDKEAQNGND